MMAVYRGRRGRPWLWPTLVLLAVVGLGLALGGFLFLQARGPDPAEEIARMRDLLEVLRVSHYTPEVVQEGRVVLPREYEASLEDLRLLRRAWERVRKEIPPEARGEVEKGLAGLERLVEARADPEEVAKAAEALMEALQGLAP